MPVESDYAYVPHHPQNADQTYQEYGGYITDITRSWPVSGKFSGPQKDLYEAILKVQRSCVALCRENANLSLDKLHSIAEDGLKDQLKQLGFDVSGTVSIRVDFCSQALPATNHTIGSRCAVPTPPRPLYRTRCS